MDALTRAATEIQRQHPTLPPGRAYALALEADPDLARAHHHGQVPPVPPAAAEPDHHDPGALLLAEIARRVAAGADREDARRQVFAQFPDVAACYLRGELIPKAPQASKVGAPVELVRFRAPLGGVVAGSMITGVEVFRVGEWNGRQYPASALDDMVQAFAEAGYRPPVTLGHNAPDDALAHGHVARLYRQGDVLLADLAGVPAETIQAIREGRILSVSAEVYIGLKRGGRTFPHAIRALSLLGAHPPGVNLRPIAESLPPT